MHLDAFFDELLKIATGAPPTETPEYELDPDHSRVPYNERKPASWPQARVVLRNALVGGAAMGLGYAGGRFVGREVLPRVWPHLPPESLQHMGNLAAGLGTGGALAAAAMLARHKQMFEDAK